MEFRSQLMPHQYEPFNGDHFVQAEFLKLKEKFGLKTAIETGTCLGSTSKWLSEIFEKVYTIEFCREYWEHALKVFTGDINYLPKDRDAKRYMVNIKNIYSYLGSSPEMLRHSILDSVDNKTIIFLDAHWSDQYCPLKDELNAIADFGLKPVIAIHDFFVPGKPDLGYDFIHGQPFTYEWLKPEFDRIYGEGKYEYHYNSEATEIKRGLIYLYPKIY